MRTTLVATFAAASASICCFGACTADVHDNVVNADVALDFDADVSDDGVEAGDAVSVNMDATGVVLVEPKDEPPVEDKDKACHFKVFLDDEDSEPLTVTAQTHVMVTIPKSTPEGKHHLICRLFKHDDTPTDTEKSISINVSASASVSVNGDAGTAQL